MSEQSEDSSGAVIQQNQPGYAVHPVIKRRRFYHKAALTFMILSLLVFAFSFALLLLAPKFMIWSGFIGLGLAIASAITMTLFVDFKAPGWPVYAKLLEPANAALPQRPDGYYQGRAVELRVESNMNEPGIIFGKSHTRELTRFTATMAVAHPFNLRIYRQSGKRLLCSDLGSKLKNISAKVLPGSAALMFTGMTIECDKPAQFMSWLEDRDAQIISALLNDCCMQSVELAFGCIRTRSEISSAAGEQNVKALLETMNLTAKSLERFSQSRSA